MLIHRLLVNAGLRKGPFVPVVRLSGVIAARSRMHGSLSLAGVDGVLKRAFTIPGTQAVALVVNSPGGSPVQSALIHRRIRQLAADNDKKVLVFCEDVAASGGYWLACAGDEIFADAGSIVGSIGVVTAGFGFPEALKKLGIERRLHTSGDNKRRLDPFQPERKGDVAKLKDLQGRLHAQFNALVRDRRGDKLKGEEAELFSGDFWTGEEALGMGLIDGLGDLHGVLRDRYGKEVKLLPVEQRIPFWRRRFGPGLALDTAGLTDDLIDGLEARAHWDRVGL